MKVDVGNIRNVQSKFSLGRNSLIAAKAILNNIKIPSDFEEITLLKKLNNMVGDLSSVVSSVDHGLDEVVRNFSSAEASNMRTSRCYFLR